LQDAKATQKMFFSLFCRTNNEFRRKMSNFATDFPFWAQIARTPTSHIIFIEQQENGI